MCRYAWNLICAPRDLGVQSARSVADCRQVADDTSVVHAATTTTTKEKRLATPVLAGNGPSPRSRLKTVKARTGFEVSSTWQAPTVSNVA